ncbi:MAG: iron-containing alcohol dehydrogenase [Candidatus Margulisbacteria bacterium]|nr:iron-containing alcohol dehydrogenase [Candidatus Margulisiibacteriota bacterium]
MDAAKAIALLAKNTGKIWEYVYKGPGQKYKKFNKALPLIMVPTLAATGSELNSGAVISNPETREKTVLFGADLYPKITIIDPGLTKSVPYTSTVDGAVDIIVHVLEMYLSTKDVDYLQDQLALALTKTVKKNLDILKVDLANSAARAEIFWAAALALSGIVNKGRSGEFPMHDIEHVLSGFCDNLAHGRGLAKIFLEMLNYEQKEIPGKIINLSKNVFEQQINNATEAIKKWQEWFAFHETGDSLKEYIGDIPVEKIADKILQFSGTPDFLPNVRIFEKSELINFIQALI